MDKAQQLELTASEVVAAIATGHLNAETYVQTLLERAEAANELLPPT
ncbi:hypothetical protein [Pandoraea cepalis]|nr:hypothetical protein [Pandoraea cepalis]